MFSNFMKDVFKPFLMMKVTGTVFVFSLALNRMSSNKAKTTIAGSLTLHPNRSSPGVLLFVFEVLRCVFSALCTNAPKDRLRLGLHDWSARFIDWTALSASPLALGWWTGGFYFSIPTDSHHCLRSPLTNLGPLSDTKVFGIPKLAKVSLRYVLTASDVLYPAGKASIQIEPASIITKILPWPLIWPQSTRRRSQTSVSGHAEIVFLKLCLFTWQFLHLLTKCSTSWVMSGNHAIILIDISVVFFPGCVSCAFAKTKCRSLCGIKGTTPLKMIPLRTVSTFSILFLLLNFVSNCHFWFISLCLGKVCLFQVQIWFLFGLPNRSERSRCYWLRSTHNCCRIRLRQNPFCMGYLLSWSVLPHNRSPLELLPIFWF